MVVGCTFHIYDLFLWKVSREKQCGIYCIDRIENVDKYKSASCLYHIDKMQIFLFIYNIRFVYGCYFYDFSYIGSCRTHIYNVS